MTKYRHFDRKVESRIHHQKVKNTGNYSEFATFGQNCAYKMVGRTLQILIKYGQLQPLTQIKLAINCFISYQYDTLNQQPLF